MASLGIFLSKNISAEEIATYTINHSYSLDKDTTDILTSKPATGTYIVKQQKTLFNNENLSSLLSKDIKVPSSSKEISITELKDENNIPENNDNIKKQVHPMGNAKFYISSPFGEARSMILTNGQYYSDIHNGVDYVSEDGTPILAYRDGEVVYSGNDAGEGIIIKHDNGLYSHSWHLREGSRKFKVGDIVKAGDIIGLQGSTGMVTGSHLHFELSRGYNYDYINPEDYL